MNMKQKQHVNQTSSGDVAVADLLDIASFSFDSVDSTNSKSTMDLMMTKTTTSTTTQSKPKNDIQSFKKWKSTANIMSTTTTKATTEKQQQQQQQKQENKRLSLQIPLSPKREEQQQTTVITPTKKKTEDMKNENKTKTTTVLTPTHNKTNLSPTGTTPTTTIITPTTMKDKSTTPKSVESTNVENNNDSSTSTKTTKSKSTKSPNNSNGTTKSPSRFGLMPWSKKKDKKHHRRTKSMEFKATPQPIDQKENNARSSVPNSPVKSPTEEQEQHQANFNKSIIQDLMGLKVSNNTSTANNALQMPSLAKPSPTSFLMGNEDEMVGRTCELDPSPHQMEIPPLSEFVVSARLIEFVDNYRKIDQNFDLQAYTSISRLNLQHQVQHMLQVHQPIIQSFLDCGEYISSIHGVITSDGTNADDRVEVVIVEAQRQFIVVFRGTTEQQTKGAITSKSKKKHSNNNHSSSVVPLDNQHNDVDVYGCFKDEYEKVEKDCFALLDTLTESNPFCDIIFTGYSFGGAMATLAAFKYANARSMIRVNCYTLGSPKVGFSSFKRLVNSLPNLKVMRLEFGQDNKCLIPSAGGYHVGHTLVLHSSLGTTNTSKSSSASKSSSFPMVGYKFDTPKIKKFKTIHPNLKNYISALEEMLLSKLPWINDFKCTGGKGVLVNDEIRQVV